tara:strand:- start:5502 stop:5780 length:279 start_codon:yes stop_codon:yes gene_type:complete
MAYTPARRRAGKKTPKPKKTPSNAKPMNPAPGQGPSPGGTVIGGGTNGWGQVNIVRGPNGAKFDCPPKAQYGNAGVVTITSDCIEIVDITGG